MSENKKVKESTYEQQESKLSAQSSAFIKLLMQRGILGDTEIDDDKIRQAQKEKKRHTYHNTEMLLQHYRDIVWALECFPTTIVEELDRPLDDLDAIISYIDTEISLDNRKLESRIESIKKSRLLLERVNDALTILKKKPDNGEKMYNLIYLTYIAPEKLTHSELLFRLDISSRHYYRLRQQAMGILSIRLWAAPVAEMDSWLEVLNLLEHLC